MKKRLSQVCRVLLASVLFTTAALGQKASQAGSENIINTTWQLYFKESARDSWNEEVKLTFLSGGKLKVDGQVYPRTEWRLRGKKLIFSYSNDAGMLGEGEVTMQGNHSDGGGQLGMRGTPFIIRLVKLVSNIAQPTGRPTSPREGMIPSEIQSLLNSKYQGWRLAKPSREDTQTCFDKRSGFQPSMVWGDFNGDRQTDYAIQIIHRQQVILLAFLNQGATYTQSAINSGPLDGTIPVLAISKKGEKYLDHERNRNGIYPFETVTAVYCEASAISFIFRNGRFVKVFVSD